MAPDGEIIVRIRRDSAQNYVGTRDVIAAIVADVEREAGTANAPVGLGHPGSTNPHTGLIRNANSTWLNGQPFAADLADTLRRPVRLANDADCFALSEARDGAAAGAGCVFGVILGTGVGGGVIVNGAPLKGGQGIAGEWGHNPLPWASVDESPGPQCWCGQTGCIETWLSGPALARDHGGGLTARAICAAAEAGDAAAIASLARYGDRLERALAGVVNLLDPDIIVLGGGMSNADGLAQSVETALAAHVFCDTVTTRVVPNAHGDSSGVRGAAWLWPAGET